MGTNYYAFGPCCKTCGRGDGRVHIGKSSYPWKFLFAPLDRPNGESIVSWAGWQDYLKDKTIVDEYGGHVLLEDLVALVKSKQDGWCADTAPNEAYGGVGDRSSHEYKDAEGYRICTTADFS